jgi:hypothetical protein
MATQPDLFKIPNIAKIVATALDEYVPPDTPMGDTTRDIVQEQAVQLRAFHGIPEPTRDRNGHDPHRFGIADLSEA